MEIQYPSDTFSQTGSVMTNVLCVSENGFPEELRSLLEENRYKFLFSRGALKVEQLLSDDSVPVGLVLWEAEKFPGLLQIELAEVFNRHLEIPVLLFFKGNGNAEEYSKLLESASRHVDLFDGNANLLIKMELAVETPVWKEAGGESSFDNLLASVGDVSGDESNLREWKPMDSSSMVSPEEKDELTQGFSLPKEENLLDKLKVIFSK